MRVSRTILGGAGTVVGLVAVGGLVVGGAPHRGRDLAGRSEAATSASRGCRMRMDSGFWVCAGSAGVAPGARERSTPTSSSATETPSLTAAVKAASVVVAGPPFPAPFEIGPGKPWLAGQPEPQARPLLLMQVSAGLATAPASPTATVLLSDWPAAGPGTVTISVYSGDTSNACSSPPLRTEAAAVLINDPGLWRATFSGLVVGSYEVQATFAGKAGPMTTPCGRAALKVVAAPGSGQ